MPKLKKKSTKRIRRSKKKSSLWIFLLMGVVASFALWLLIKDPLPHSTDQESYSQAELDDSPSHKDSKKAIARKSAKHDKVNTIAKTNARAKDAKQVEAPKPVQTDLEVSIKAAIAKLGIPQNYYRRHKSGITVTYSIPIDRSNMDLIYANMIFKGELERAGAKLLKGTDSSSKQTLSFSSPHNRNTYVLNLFYDSKLYAKKKSPRTIAIVVDDFGAISGDLLEGFLALDKEVCFAIFPDEDHSVETMHRAKAQGRESIIHVPMEPIGYPKVNPGKNAVFVQYDAGTIERLITRFIKQLPDAKGINNHMGSLATTDEDIMQTVMATLKKHNKFFLDSRTSNVSVAYSVAQKAHIPAFRNDIFLDSPNISQSTMDAKLSQIIELSATRNNIIAITHCHSPEKLRYLKSFIARLKAAGFTLVPLSEIGQYNVPEIL